MKIQMTVLCMVHNEESRIQQLLGGLGEFDQILLVDKASTDRTAELAQAFPNVEYHRISYTDDASQAFGPILPLARNEWVFHLTASDYLTAELKTELQTLIAGETNFDIIDVPYRTHVLGYWLPNSPWHNGYARPICRKNLISFRSTIHGELEFRSNRIYQISDDGTRCIHHLTHPTVDQLMERHLRYTKIESKQKNLAEIDLKKERREFRRLFWRLLVRDRLPFSPQGGFELFLAFLSYWLFRYLYFSEVVHGRGESKYEEEYYKKTRQAP